MKILRLSVAVARRFGVVKLAIVYTYDESGGLADHVPPPKACLASASEANFDHHGVRVPITLISP